MNVDVPPNNADAPGPSVERAAARFVWKRHVGALSLLVMVWLFVCGPLLGGREVVAFRDAGYLYYPLWKYMDEIEQTGDVPLWNPLDNGGRPLAADLSSAAFYPGRLIFRLRFLSFDARFGWYLALHVWLATMATYHVGLCLNANRTGALLGALGYGFGGPILFQVANPIYLVGAAWLPYALFGLFAGLMEGRNGWLTAGIVATAMMFLGGDPQNVYHLLLIAAALTVASLLRRRSGRNKDTDASAGKFTVLCRATIFVATFSGLCAVQIIPTAEWTRYSDRSESSLDASSGDSRRVAASRTDEKPLRPDSDATRGTGLSRLFTRPPVGSHAEQVYQFSQPPWTLAELALPNISGRPFPQHQRWIQALPGADRMWQPSLYLGLVTLVFSLGHMIFRRGRFDLNPNGNRTARGTAVAAPSSGDAANAKGRDSIETVFPLVLSLVAVWFGLGAMGWYGPVWLGREILASFGLLSDAPREIAEPVGGVYWLMVTLLPGYRQFRYPAKLMVLASLALCLLAARGATVWMNAPGPTTERLKRIIAWLAILAVATLALARFIPDWLPASPPDPVWGPLRTDELVAVIVRSSLHALAVCAALWWIIRWHCRRFDTSGGDVPMRHFEMRLHRRHWPIGAIIVLIQLSDIVLANRWLVPTVDARAFHEPVKEQYVLRNVLGLPYPVVEFDQNTGDPSRFRSVYELAWRESGFDRTSSPNRLAEVIRAERAWALPKHHLLIPAINYHSFSSIEPRPSVASFQPMLRVTGESALWEWVETRPNRFEVLVETKTNAVVEWLPAKISGWKCRVEGLPLAASQDGNSGSGSGSRMEESRNGASGRVELPPGRWNIAWDYRPTGYLIGRWISALTAIVLVLKLGLFWRARRAGAPS